MLQSNWVQQWWCKKNSNNALVPKHRLFCKTCYVFCSLPLSAQNQPHFFNKWSFRFWRGKTKNSWSDFWYLFSASNELFSKFADIYYYCITATWLNIFTFFQSNWANHTQTLLKCFQLSSIQNCWSLFLLLFPLMTIRVLKLEFRKVGKTISFVVNFEKTKFFHSQTGRAEAMTHSCRISFCVWRIPKVAWWCVWYQRSDNKHFWRLRKSKVKSIFCAWSQNWTELKAAFTACRIQNFSPFPPIYQISLSFSEN